MAQSSTSELCPKDEDIIYDLQEAAFFSRSCCIFLNFPCFRSFQSDDWERISTSGGEQQDGVHLSWWEKGLDTLKKLREWSELVAGPKWKTFIRRFSKTAGKARPTRFQYDALSYSLNFDEGREREQNGQMKIDMIYRDFSSRYAATPRQNGAAT